MVHNQTTNFRNLAAQFFLGGIALALATLAFFLASRRPRLGCLRLFDCAVLPDGQLPCISAACHHVCCRLGVLFCSGNLPFDRGSLRGTTVSFRQ